MKIFFGSGKLSTDVIPLDIDHAKHSVGGMNGHIFRRFTHVIMCLIPILYYTKGDRLSDFLLLRDMKDNLTQTSTKNPSENFASICQKRFI